MTSSERALSQMIATGQWSTSQFMGRRWPIGCVALEITQRCNLDCMACYLSDHSEAVKDLPLEEVFRRIDLIFDYYGSYTDVQVTGGDPTLRKRDELVAIIKRIRQKGMRPSLFTNGIKATRSLLEELVEAGLVDVAFHVDMTQERNGYSSEIALNALRREYIERARGLPLAVMFNTTVFDGNFDQVPEVVRFFVEASDVVRMASFQLLAKIGRGTLGQRRDSINIASAVTRIEQGAGIPISFDTARIGHAHCNRYAMILVANGRAFDLLDDKTLFNTILQRTSHLQFDRQNRARAVRTFVGWLLKNPIFIAKSACWIACKLWAMKRDLFVARGRANKLSFFVHNFMDSCHLEKDRINACVFMNMTGKGPISMCMHNAKRDTFILDPVGLKRQDGEWLWDPLTGRLSKEKPVQPSAVPLPRQKNAKGRLKRSLVVASDQEGR
jgi:molybdenum cofactor biosynthesis enzyme MoaA